MRQQLADVIGSTAFVVRELVAVAPLIGVVAAGDDVYGGAPFEASQSAQ
jgi:hypothetical protein